ncbi:MAG: S49 family peptidase [Planctomycetales bacterium]
MKSPGGTVAGTKELADEISAADKKKPVWSYCNDLCASAGYWGASHASKVFANDMAMVGSIGTFMVINDYSQMFQDAGVKVHVIRAGDFKGSGTPGTEVTEEHLAEWQSKVDQLNSFFTAGVKKYRGFSAKQITDIADGRVHIVKSAVDLGLIDGVQSLDKTLAALSKQKHPTGATASVPEQVMTFPPITVPVFGRHSSY